MQNVPKSPKKDLIQTHIKKCVHLAAYVHAIVAIIANLHFYYQNFRMKILLSYDQRSKFMTIYDIGIKFTTNLRLYWTSCIRDCKKKVLLSVIFKLAQIPLSYLPSDEESYRAAGHLS